MYTTFVAMFCDYVNIKFLQCIKCDYYFFSSNEYTILSVWTITIDLQNTFNNTKSEVECVRVFVCLCISRLHFRHAKKYKKTKLIEFLFRNWKKKRSKIKVREKLWNARKWVKIEYIRTQTHTYQKTGNLRLWKIYLLKKKLEKWSVFVVVVVEIYSSQHIYLFNFTLFIAVVVAI